MKNKILIFSVILVLSSCIGDDKGTAQSTDTISANNTTQAATQTATQTQPNSRANAKSVVDNTAQSATQNNQSTAADNSKLGKSVKGLKSGCDLLSKEFVAEVFGIDVSELTLKPSGQGMEHGKACFYKWDKEGVKDAGMFVQVQHNPMPEEFPDWAAYYVKAKLDHGDKTPDSKTDFRYKSFDALGKVGAYNYELGRYVWRTDEGNIFMVAFNLNGSEAEYSRFAEMLGKEAMSNFY